MSERREGPQILVSAPEASGDRYAAEVVRELRRRAPQAALFGVGGPGLRGMSVDLIARAEDIAVTGLLEALARLPAVWRALQAIHGATQDRRPQVALLVDSPDFNFRLLRRLKAAGTRVVYFVSPQLWAWRKGRVRKIARHVDRMLVIFPFEEGFYRQHGVEARFVGHPLVDQVQPVGAGIERPVVGLLPGSRPNEISRLLAPLLGAAEKLHAEFPAMRFVLPVAPTLELEEIDAAAARCSAPIEVTTAPVREALAGARLALTASGTATVELALLGVPMVIVYRVSALTWLIGRLLVRVEHIGMVNILASRRVAPELLQDAVSAERIAAEGRQLLADREARDRQREALSSLRDQLGPEGAATRVAEELLA